MPCRETLINALRRAPAACAWERVQIACGDSQVIFPPSQVQVNFFNLFGNVELTLHLNRPCPHEPSIAGKHSLSFKGFNS